MKQSRVYVAYTGGTVGMTRTAEGYAPAPGLLDRLMREVPQLGETPVPAFDVHEYPELLDSANMRPEDWNYIAADIAAHYAAYDGFVVLHGTDTMAYTAAALSFMLEGLDKPVVVTGSQIPLCEPRNDARDNLIDALIIAGHHRIPEVCLAFNGRVLRGNRAVKVKSAGLGAFESPNFPPLAELGIDIVVYRERVLAPARTPFRMQRCGSAPVAALRLFPGIPAEFLRHIVQPPLAGLVLECYGAGNGPVRDTAFLDVLRAATDRGVVIVDVSQCLQGSVNLDSYAAGSALARAGVIGGYDMTVEAALTKLLYLFELGLSPDDVKREMQRDLRGELTRPE